MSRWIKPRPEFYVQTGGMNENPFGVPKDEIVRMLIEQPAEISAQVVFGKYVQSSGKVFRSEAIENLWDRSVQRVMTNFYADRRVTEEAKQLVRHADEYGSPFHTGVDVARQTDWTVITTLDTRVRPARLVYWKRLQRVPWETIYGEIGRTRAIFGPNILVDSSGPGGDVVMDALESRYYCPLHSETFLVSSPICPGQGVGGVECKPEHYLALSCCEGYHFTGTTKKELVEHLRNVLEVGFQKNDPERPFGWIKSPPIPTLEEELAFYEWEDKKLQTDSVFSLALAAWSGLEEVLEDPVFGSVYGN
jgi:hypothetical protein